MINKMVKFSTKKQGKVSIHTHKVYGNDSPLTQSEMMQMENLILSYVEDLQSHSLNFRFLLLQSLVATCLAHDDKNGELMKFFIKELEFFYKETREFIDA